MSVSDCKYFLSGTCRNGDLCEFRHSDAAKKSGFACKFWSAGRCIRDDCAFLHPAHRAASNRSLTPCYWLTQPNGCNKGESCPYLHSSNGSSSSASSLSASKVDFVKPLDELLNVEARHTAEAKKILARASVSSAAVARGDDVILKKQMVSEPIAKQAEPKKETASVATKVLEPVKPLSAKARTFTPSASKPKASSGGTFVKSFAQIMAEKDNEKNKTSGNKNNNNISTTIITTTNKSNIADQASVKSKPKPKLDIEALKLKNKRKFGTARNKDAAVVVVDKADDASANKNKPKEIKPISEPKKRKKTEPIEADDINLVELPDLGDLADIDGELADLDQFL